MTTPALDGKGYGTNAGARALANANPAAPVNGCSHGGYPVAEFDGRCFLCRPRDYFLNAPLPENYRPRGKRGQ